MTITDDLPTTTTPTVTTTTTLDERVVGASIAALELFSIHIGERLGLYAALRDEGPLTFVQLAAAASIDERYAQEWVEQQAVAGLLAVATESSDAECRMYALPREHEAALVDVEAVAHVAPLARMVVGIAKVLDDVVAAYRTGDGVPYARYGLDFRSGQGAINRPAFSSALVDEWLPALGDVANRLAAGGRVADVGCGQGWSTIAVAKAFPNAEVVGIDADVASVDDAIENARYEDARARFLVADATALAGDGPFDLVLILEALHDMAAPIDVLTAARSALAGDGCVLVADEKVADAFAAPGDELERMMYGWSVVHCLPAARAAEPSAALGTVLREGTVRELAAAAGFGSVDVLPVDGGFFRLYRLNP